MSEDKPEEKPRWQDMVIDLSPEQKAMRPLKDAMAVLEDAMIGVRVQKGVPIPSAKPRGKSGRRTPTYPWDTMNIGDSFVFPLSIGRSGYAAALQAGRSRDKRFVVRKMDGGSYRCWRVA